MTKTIHVVTPTRANVRAELSQFREWLVGTERRYHLSMGISDAQPIANNRNRIVKRFLESSGDFLLMIDSDGTPTRNPLDLVELDKDVIGFPYLTWRVNNDVPLFWFPAVPDGQGLIEVKEMGSGCLLIARRVLEHPDMIAPFLDQWDEDGLRTVPEDMSFCWRARDAGFKVWCDFSAPLMHFKTVELLTLWRYLKQAGFI